jgi:hypothetical protein
MPRTYPPVCLGMSQRCWTRHGSIAHPPVCLGMSQRCWTRHGSIAHPQTRTPPPEHAHRHWLSASSRRNVWVPSCKTSSNQQKFITSKLVTSLSRCNSRCESSKSWSLLRPAIQILVQHVKLILKGIKCLPSINEPDVSSNHWSMHPFFSQEAGDVRTELEIPIIL